MDPHHKAFIPRYKVSELIKDAVIRQMAFYISRNNFSIMNNCNRIFRALVQIADNGNDVTSNAGCNFLNCADTGGLKRWTKR
jgi:hypothetical protein